MASAKPNQKIHVDKLQATREKLEQLDVKQREELTLRESIYLLRDKLRGALKKGYSYEDLSEILESQGILVSAATLKQYLTESNKEASKGKRVKARGETKQSYPKAAEKNVLRSSESITKSTDKEFTAGEEKELSKAVTSVDDRETLSLSEVNLLESNNQASSRESQQDNKKPVRGKSKKPGSSSKDLSSEFNQY